MAQISYIKYTDVKEARRYDAEYFKPEYLEIEKKFSNCPTINDIALSVVCGPFGSTILNSTYTKSGIEVVRPFNIKNYSVEEDNIVYISEKDAESKKLKIFEMGDLFFARVGDIRAGVFTRKKATISPNIIGVKINKNKQNPYFLSIFFNTRYGFPQMLREQKIVAQPTISTKTVRGLKVPNFTESFQLQIAKTVKFAHQKQTQSKQLYREAKELLLAELGILDYQVKHALTFSTSKKEIEEAHRYDSEYFQPKYAEIIKKIEEHEGGWDLVKNVINFRDKNYNPKDNQKYKYLALSNISSQGYIQDYQEEFGKDLPSRARRKINTNDLIISSIEGSLSSCALVEKELDNAVCSTGFFVLNSERINSETLLILFKSFAIQELLQRGSKGTILTAISKTELESIKIPLIIPSTQKQIAEKIQESHKLRKESKELLEEAKRKVEEEIEKESFI